MIMNVTITNVFLDKLVLNVYVGLQTFVKQINVNYFILQSPNVHFQFSIGSNTNIMFLDYRTLDLDDYTGLRKQVFTN